MNGEEGPEDPAVLARAAVGDMEAWGALLARHQGRLMSVVYFRLDPRLRGRIDPADVIQETFVAATERRAEFFRQRESERAQPLFLWLRWMAGNTLLEIYRHHLGSQMRDVRREVSSDAASAQGCRDDDSTRAAIVAQLTCGVTGPATRAEHRRRRKPAAGQRAARRARR
jgi:RNA polymerase sigma-70 factor (ECF subfamily)